MITKVIFTSTLFTAFCEFISKGASWLKLFLLAYLVPLEQFGEVALIVGLIIAFGGLMSFPVTMEIITKHHKDYIPFIQTAIILILFLPIQVVFYHFLPTMADRLYILIISSCCLSLNQVMYYFLRVHNIILLNFIKILSETFSFFIFIILVPIDISYIPFAYLFSLLITSIAIYKLSINSNTKLKNSVNKNVLFGWIIFITQALFSALSQNGVRLVIAETMSLQAVGVFTKTYLIGTSLFFVYSALMIKIEPKLAKIKHISEIDSKITLALRLLVLLWTCLFFFGLFLYSLYIFASEIELIKLIFINVDWNLLVIIIFYLGISPLRYALKPLLLSIERRSITTYAVILGGTVQFGYLAIKGIVGALTINDCGWSFVIFEVLTVSYMLLYFILYYKRRKSI
jgi:O-antigen/teichoic acid export membrane protein